MWEAVSKRAAVASSLTLLDYGCNEGALIAVLARSFPNVTVVGIDKNRDAIACGTQRLTQSRLSLHNSQDPIGWLEGQRGFDMVLSMGVVEHVVEQERLLAGLAGALNPGGALVLSVPGKNMFSWADFGNWKFYFPRLHQWYVESTRGADFYRTHFVECANGLFGDVEVGKNRHQHFRRREIVSLVSAAGCEVIEIDGYGFFYRILHNIWWFLPPFLKSVFRRLVLVDLRVGSSAELIIEARK
ncbi:MAG: methyltransferase domain-containing protein [Gammaproteobacteria bacterium]|nr:methyltransferase domain-containing protein [Gammaproteobacteria bacterium]